MYKHFRLSFLHQSVPVYCLSITSYMQPNGSCRHIFLSPASNFFFKFFLKLGVWRLFFLIKSYTFLVLLLWGHITFLCYWEHCVALHSCRYRGCDGHFCCWCNSAAIWPLVRLTQLPPHQCRRISCCCSCLLQTTPSGLSLFSNQISITFLSCRIQLVVFIFTIYFAIYIFTFMAGLSLLNLPSRYFNNI